MAMPKECFVFIFLFFLIIQVEQPVASINEIENQVAELERTRSALGVTPKEHKLTEVVDQCLFVLNQQKDHILSLQTSKLEPTSELEAVVSLLDLDRLEDKQLELQSILEVRHGAIKEWLARLDQVSLRANDIDRRRRRLLDQQADPYEVRLAELEQRLANSKTELIRLELSTDQRQVQIDEWSLKTVEEALARVSRQTLIFEESEFNQLISTIDEQIKAFQQLRDQSESRRSKAESQLQGFGPSAPDGSQAAELRECYLLAQDESRLRNQQIERLQLSKQIWTVRRDMLLKLSKQSNRDELGAMEILSNAHISTRAHDVRRRLFTLKSQGSVWPATPEYFENLSVALDDELASRQVYNRLLSRAKREAKPLPALDVSNQVSQFWGSAKRLWHYELVAIDDRPVTVSKVIAGLLLFIIGVWLAKRASQAFAERILGKFGVSEGVAGTVRIIIYYVAILIFTMLALHVINIPLTVFTFLGGAIAIGVGFGSQNLMNNFFGGLILLAERTVRIGDLIEVGGLRGRIAQIGGRSTRIQTADGVEIIVPNSAFVQQNVINWTLSHNRVRLGIKVGVAYGSKPEQVAAILTQCACAHERVLKKNEPFVFFEDFGDNALVFTVYFWIMMSTFTDGQRIQSDIRFTIDQKMSEAKIVIAFPQRDVHLFVDKPLRVDVQKNPP